MKGERMAARLLFKVSKMTVLTLSALMLFMIILSIPAVATTINAAITPPMQPVTVNSDYSVIVTLNDPAGSGGKTIALSVPAGTITSSVNTDSGGNAPASLHTPTVAGYNNITAVYNGLTYIIPIYVSPGPITSFSLSVTNSFRLANGLSTARASARALDNYNNPISGVYVTYVIDGTTSTVLTDNQGYADVTIGPYVSTHTVNISASNGSFSKTATVRFLDRNNLFLNRVTAPTMPVGSVAGVDATFYEDLGSLTPAASVPLYFTAYGPDFVVLDTYSGVTDANGKVSFSFTMSQKVGNNTIVVTNSEMGGVLQSTIIYGAGGDVSNLIIWSDPASPVYADGTTKYTLNIIAVDSGGNPVKNKDIEIVKNLDTNYTIDGTTNNYGYMAVNIPASAFVCNDLWTVNTYSESNASVVISNSTTLSYIAGPAAILTVVADPNAVANANVTTPVDSYDVHMTDIIVTVTDKWGHPLPGQAVTVTSLNTTLGNITGPSAGTTSDSGEFTTQFTLSSKNYGNDTVIGAPIRAVSGSLMGNTSVLYTDNSFLSIKSSITPKSNLSINDTINVNITIRGIGWKIKGKSYDIALIFDSSGSMNWLSTTIYPTNGEPETGYIPAVSSSYPDVKTRTSSGRSIYDYDPKNWYYIDSYTYQGDGSQPIQIMLSSSYYNYSSSGTYYQLKVQDPNGNNYSTSEHYYYYNGYPPELFGADYEHSANENYVTITNPVNGGTYKIYGAYKYRDIKGAAPYNLMVLTMPKRLGLKNYHTNDSDSAAKVAARSFVNNMTDNQVSVIWFNTSSGVSTHLKTVNSVNKSTINNGINSLNANGGTEIGHGISSAISELTGSYSNKSNKKVAILLSDGYSQTPSDDITQANLAKSNNITIFTIGMGMPDEYNLGQIANITGGNYTKVVSDVELEHVYGDIASELNKVVANTTDMHIITNSTVVNGNLYPDAVYVPGSAWVKYPNGTIVAQEPTINTSGIYDLKWNPGTIKLNDTWTLNYQLKLMKNGTIEPISNKSYISFMREDGSNDTAYFVIETLYVSSNSSNDFSTNSSKLNLTITSPLNASHGKVPYNITTPTQMIKWKINYTGNYTYTQTVRINDTAMPVAINYIGNEYTMNLAGKAPGDYLVTITATEQLPMGAGDEAYDTILLRIINNNGQITLG